MTVYTNQHLAIGTLVIESHAPLIESHAAPHILEVTPWATGKLHELIY